MKSFIVFALFIAAAVAAPVGPDAEASVLRYESDNIGVDGYNYNYETSNGIRSQETGQIQGLGTDDEGMEVSGSFSYPGPDGVTYTVTYTAGKGGFEASGAHIPQA